MTVILGNNNTVEEKWKNIKQILKNKTEEVLVTREKEARKPWITEEIIEFINERKYKNQYNIKSQQNYKRIKNIIQSKSKEAKEKWLDNQCTVVEEYLKMGKLEKRKMGRLSRLCKNYSAQED